VNVTQTAGCLTRAPQWQNTTDRAGEFGVPEVNAVDTRYECAQNACSVRNIPSSRAAESHATRQAAFTTPAVLRLWRQWLGPNSRGCSKFGTSTTVKAAPPSGFVTRPSDKDLSLTKRPPQIFIYLLQNKFPLISNNMSNICQTKLCTVSCAAKLNVFANKTFHEIIVTSPILCSLCPKHGWCAIP